MNAVSKCKVSNFLEFFFEKWNNMLITRENRKMRIFQSVKNQHIAKRYKKIAKKTNGLVFIDPPFDFAKYIYLH